MSKKVSNSKIIFIITLFFVLCCLMATGSRAARKIEFTSTNAQGFIQKLNQNNSSTNTVRRCQAK